MSLSLQDDHSFSEERERERLRDMAGTVSRGAHTMNSMFVKPMVRKAYHRKSSAETMRDTVKFEGEEVKSKTHMGSTDGGCCWVPHERSGIYYPKGQEKVIDRVPPGAVKDDIRVNWFSYSEDGPI